MKTTKTRCEKIDSAGQEKNLKEEQGTNRTTNCRLESNPRIKKLEGESEDTSGMRESGQALARNPLLGDHQQGLSPC
jgi:hypothetical protein